MAGKSWFGPDSMMWKINRESVLLLGGRPALLMQLAHPAVAAGVAQHSDFRADPLGRLTRTLDAMLTIMFGDADSADATIAAINARHARVAGTTEDGRPYSARDPHLLTWVYWTLVDSSLQVYQACVASLSSDEIARYYEETKLIAEAFGIPAGSLPATIAELNEWARRLVDEGEVRVTPLARELAVPILRPLPIVPARLAHRSSIVAAALLPPPIRAGYGLKLARSDVVALALGRHASRLVVRALPRRVRLFGAARAASA